MLKRPNPPRSRSHPSTCIVNCKPDCVNGRARMTNPTEPVLPTSWRPSGHPQQ
ncbi:hypothetical protein OOK60_07065 [Trichothermofontia sichuanensis B231]|uniref:hypothetical protein n=1 Tax=Trichothermofontia sichuanensis TaxID=3045816 RepID=UPI0022454B92|nr:hypothetical protein [Trichothermofontia sichuanensis]UZQ55821.1 hypothetical protein OOK60_07065 [Trichothermofontia sichuanensis B231]